MSWKKVLKQLPFNRLPLCYSPVFSPPPSEKTNKMCFSFPLLLQRITFGEVLDQVLQKFNCKQELCNLATSFIQGLGQSKGFSAYSLHLK